MAIRFKYRHFLLFFFLRHGLKEFNNKRLIWMQD